MTQNPAQTKEMVAVFDSKNAFEAAAAALLDAGFEESDLSILSTHDAYTSVLEKTDEKQSLFLSLFARAKYEMPLVASGLIAMTEGPAGAAIAALVAAGVGGVATKRVLDEVTSVPDSNDFVRALEAGSLILWVAVSSDEKKADAEKILKKHQGKNIHLHNGSVSA